MAGMNWIKFYCGQATTSDKVEAILEEFGSDGFGKYWLLLGLLGQKFDENSDKIKVKNGTLLKLLRFKSKKKMDLFLLSSEIKTILKVEKVKNDFIFDSSILLELKSRDFKLTRSSRGKTAYKNKSKNKEKEIDIDIYTHAKKLIEYWNSKGLKPAELIPQNLQAVSSGLNKQLKKNRGLNQVMDAVDNYALVLKDPTCYYTHSYMLRSFVESESTERFYSENFSQADYINFKAQPSTERSKYAN